jgi:hypothetical protein
VQFDKWVSSRWYISPSEDLFFEVKVAEMEVIRLFTDGDTDEFNLTSNYLLGCGVNLFFFFFCCGTATFIVACSSGCPTCSFGLELQYSDVTSCLRFPTDQRRFTAVTRPARFGGPQLG